MPILAIGDQGDGRSIALGIDGALFTARPDTETNFKLFGSEAVAVTGARTDCRVLALRLKPNQDFIGVLEAAAAAYGIKRARMIGGVGSIIGAAFCLKVKRCSFTECK